MKSIVYVHDLVFYRYNGLFYTSSNLPEKYFDRFFDSGVDKLTILSRIVDVDIPPQGYELIRNRNIDVFSHGVDSYWKLFSPVRIFRIFRLISSNKFLVVNVPSIHGIFTLVINLVCKRNYSVEVAADYDQFSSKRGGGLVSFVMKYGLSHFVLRSKGAAYVSRYLSSKYPTKGLKIISSNVNISTVLDESIILNRISEYENNRGPLKVGFVGGLNKRKGLDVLLASISRLSKDFDLELSLIGGHADRDWKQLVCQYGLESKVHFLGILSSDEVVNVLDAMDIYVQPSQTEGIPRATLEAMSRGLPVIATELPGFYEILDDEMLVQPGSIKELTNKMQFLICSPKVYSEQSLSNLNKAKEFTYDLLHERRTLYYNDVFNGKEE